MVKTANDVLDINPLERMGKLTEINLEKKKTIADKKKELEELERTTRVELDDLDNKKRQQLDELENKKKKELDTLDTKRKELQNLEAKKIKEIEETQALIDRSFQDLMRHKRILLQEEEKQNSKPKESGEANLEAMANTAKGILPPETNMNYSKFFEKLQAPQRLYDVTNNGFYSGLTELRNRAASGDITPEEERFIDNLRSKFEQFNGNESYAEKDQNQYIKRSMNVIEQIGSYRKLKTD